MTTVKSILMFTIILFHNNLYNKINAQISVVEICEHQSSHLIFSDPIIYADIGDSENCIFEYTNNILRLKGRKTDRITNLTVMTATQDYYSFRIMYKGEPRLNYFITSEMRLKNLSKDVTTKNGIEMDNLMTRMTLATIDSLAAKGQKKDTITTAVKAINRHKLSKQKKQTIQKERAKILLYNKALSLLKKGHLYDFIGAKHGDIRLKVTGIYHDAHYCYIVYDIQNRGAIPYDISYIEFGVKEKRRPKKSALNEKILQPLFTIKEEIRRVGPGRLNSYVAVLGKLALPQGKQLYMEVVEAGRNITLNIPYNKLRIQFLNQ